MSTNTQYTHCTFKDLIKKRILFKTNAEAKAILEAMFPESVVSVRPGEEGKTIVKVGKAIMTILIT